jgi:acyl-CoA synthetase (NDP forming)
MEKLNAIEAILEKAHLQKRTALLETEVYAILSLAGLSVPKFLFYPMPDLDAAGSALDIVSRLQGSAVVIKVVSSKTLHKTEAGGVQIPAMEKAAVEEAVRAIKDKFPEAEGVMACEFVEHSPFALGEEFMLGARADEAFGPVITLGAGGTNAEGLAAALRPGISPSIIPVDLLRNAGDWSAFLDKTWAWRYAAGKVRGARRIISDGEMLKWLEAFAYVMRYFRDGGASRFAIAEFEVNPVAVSKGVLTALDGVLRFRPAVKKERVRPSKKGIAGLLNPSTVAVVGVSDKKMNMARIILNNIVKAGFDKNRLFIVKEGAAAIDGVKCCAAPRDLPATVDMYVVAVPSAQVPDVLAEAGASGRVNGVVLISGGMGEKAGSEETAAGVACAIERAKRTNPDFVLSGGNSLGIVLPRSKVNTLFIPEYKMAYPLGENPHTARAAFVSQSGAFVISALSKMPWLKPAYSITVGNQQDITVADYVELLAEKEDLKVILVYIEGFKYADGLLLAKVIEKARRKGKQVIIYKAGRTAVGQKAVMGHTSSIAGDYLVTKTILESSGALAADNFDDFNDFTLMACYFAGFEMKTTNVFFMSNAGFEAAGMADSIAAPLAAGLIDAKLAEDMQKTLRDFKLDGIVDLKNPLDITPMAPDAAIGRITALALGSGEFGAVLLSMVPLTPAMNTLPKSGAAYPDDLERSFLKDTAERMRWESKPLLFCVAAGSLYDPYCEYALGLGIPVFRSADRAARIYREYLKYVLQA